MTLKTATILGGGEGTTERRGWRGGEAGFPVEVVSGNVYSPSDPASFVLPLHPTTFLSPSALLGYDVTKRDFTPIKGDSGEDCRHSRPAATMQIEKDINPLCSWWH